MRKLFSTLLMLVLAFTLALSATAFADKDKGKEKGRGASVRGKLTVEGVIIAVNPGASTFTMQVTKPGHENRAGAGTLVVWVQSATELKVKRGDDDDDEDEHPRRPASIGDFRVGDRVKVEGFRLDDGRLLALKVDVKNRKVAAPPEPPQGVVAQGVVTARGSNSLVVLGTNGTPRTVIVTSTTEVRGQRTSFGAIQLDDVVVVQGTVNADGTVSARQIEVVFAGGTQISGTITAKSTLGPQFLILNNALAVNVSGDTRIVSGNQLRSFDDLRVGQSITVIGSPIVIAGVTVGINARVITF